MAVAVGSPEEWKAIIVAFLRDHLRRAQAKGVAIGLSGGLDSGVVAALAVKALGHDAVHVLWLPSAVSSETDRADAAAVAKHLGLTLHELPIGAVTAALGDVVDLTQARVAGNAAARLRMTVLYAFAQQRGLLVCGTGNKSELLTGYFTKHGDGGTDLQPIGDLYKTQVRELARHLGLPAAVINKPPSAGLWAGQTDEADLGIAYDDLDAVLKGMELNSSSPDIAARSGVSLDDVLRIERMVRASEHKRRPAVVPKIGARTVGIDWRRSVHWDA